jgi:integrase
MSVTVRKRDGKWYVFVDHHGVRKARCIGTSRQSAEEVRRQLEAKLTLGDLGFLKLETKNHVPTFDVYADQWMKDYAGIECKASTASGYEGVLRLYLRPRFGSKFLTHIKRTDVKAMINELIRDGLSRSTIRNAVCVMRGIFNQAIEDYILESNPAARIGRFTRSATGTEVKGVSLTTREIQLLLEAAETVCPEYHALFLMAVRAGLRRGELVALQWGDIQFGKNDMDPNRFILVQHNYVRREHTTTKSKKSRRVDLSRELRKALIDLRDQRLLSAFQGGNANISDQLVFLSSTGTILDPDNLYHRYFQPVLTKSGLRKIRFHDLRHTFGSLLIQSGASIVYVKEQLGHSSIQVTVDTYGHLIPDANKSFVDRLDEIAKPADETRPQQSATQAQQGYKKETVIPSEVVDLIGGGAWTRTTDLRIMRTSQEVAAF